MTAHARPDDAPTPAEGALRDTLAWVLRSIEHPAAAAGDWIAYEVDPQRATATLSSNVFVWSSFVMLASLILAAPMSSSRGVFDLSLLVMLEFCAWPSTLSSFLVVLVLASPSTLILSVSVERSGSPCVPGIVTTCAMTSWRFLGSFEAAGYGSSSLKPSPLDESPASACSACNLT